MVNVYHDIAEKIAQAADAGQILHDINFGNIDIREHRYNETLCAAFQIATTPNGKKAISDFLWENNSSLYKSLARTHHKKMFANTRESSIVDQRDILAEFAGDWPKVLRGFDVNRSIKLNTYAGSCLRHRASNMRRNYDRIKRADDELLGANDGQVVDSRPSPSHIVQDLEDVQTQALRTADIVARLREREPHLITEILEGRSQREIGEALGVTHQAISLRLRKLAAWAEENIPLPAGRV